MGYRNYLGSLPKKEYNKIKRLSLKELYKHKGEEWHDDPDDRIGYVGVYDIAYNTHYELGKYVDSFDKKFFKRVFINKETQKYFEEEHDFYIVQKEFVEELINYYTEKVRTMYNKLLTPFFGDNNKIREEINLKEGDTLTEDQITSIYTLISHTREMGFEWGVMGWFKDSVPYNLNSTELVGSWKFEYAIFNLVNLYNTFDWKKNVMIYYGH
jgi:hypothetical protein